MSSEVMTHENWARLQVARRVRDIAKSMIRLSTLGRSIFPTPVHPRREAMNSPLVLRFRRRPSSMDLPQSIIPKIGVRGARALSPSKAFAVFVRGSRRDARSTAWMVRRGFPIDAVDRLVRGMRAVLDRPLTRTEIAERVSASLGVKVLAKSGRGWGGKSNATGFRIAGTVLSLDGIVFLACTRGLACFGPSRGAAAT